MRAEEFYLRDCEWRKEAPVAWENLDKRLKLYWKFVAGDQDNIVHLPVKRSESVKHPVLAKLMAHVKQIEKATEAGESIVSGVYLTLTQIDGLDAVQTVFTDRYAALGLMENTREAILNGNI